VSEILTTGSSINLQMLIIPVFLMVICQKACVFSVRHRRDAESKLECWNECSTMWKSEPLMPEACLGKNVCRSRGLNKNTFYRQETSLPKFHFKRMVGVKFDLFVNVFLVIQNNVEI